MRCLPELANAADRCRLPLCAATAVRIASALLSHSKEQRRNGFAQALATDPFLALWAVCRAECHGAELRSAETAASWLAEHALTELHWLAEEDGQSAVLAWDAAEVERQYASAVAQAQRIAGLAAHFAAQETGCAVDGAGWLGFLRGVEGPLTFRVESGAPLPAWLPAWLQAAFQQIACGDESQPPLGRCVYRALLAVAAAGDDLHTASALPQAGLEQQLERGQLSSADIGMSLDLSALVCKLSRLEILEGRFQQTLEAEKLESLKELAYGASHEINNPLANISARAQTLLKEERDPERRRRLAAIHTQAMRAHEMIADMMLFARPPQLKAGPVDLNELVNRLLKDLAPAALEQQTEVAFVPCPDSAVVSADRAQLAVALRALCVNSLEALGSAGKLTVCLRRAPANDASFGSDAVAESVQVLVSDTGPGISPEVRRHLFDPFYSGREAGRGLGFGLSKCWRIVTDHGGRIEVSDHCGAGASFIVSLPATISS